MWGSLLAGLAATQATMAIKRTVRRAILLAVAGAIAVTGVGFLLAAAYLRLSTSYDPVTAGLAIGLALLVIAGAVAFAARQIGRRAAPAPVAAPPLGGEGLPPSLAALSTSASLPLLAFAIGLLVAKSGRK